MSVGVGILSGVALGTGIGISVALVLFALEHKRNLRAEFPSRR